MIEAVNRVAGKKVPYKEAPRRSGDPAVLMASSEKIKKELGWKTEITNLDDIISSAYDWRRKNPQGYSSKLN